MTGTLERVEGERLDSHGRRELIIASIGPVVQTHPDGHEFACRVSCSAVFANEKWIFGADAGHARGEARKLLDDMFGHHGIRRLSNDNR